MPTMNLGQVRPVVRGAWSEEVEEYKAYDVVTYAGSAYLALKDTPSGYQPDSQPEYWVLFGAKGDKGDKGDAGPQGDPGPAGADGRDGADGIQGPQGPQGPPGQDGAQGPAGPQGPAGYVPPPSDAVDSDDSTAYASSKAVKTALDNAASALSAHVGTIATADALGHVKPDGATMSVAEDGALSVLNSPLWAGRNIFSSTAEPTAEAGNVGDIWLKVAG